MSCGGFWPCLRRGSPPGSAPIPVVAVEAIAHEDLAPDTTPAPPLTLSDLESTDPGLLERTLVAVPGSLPEAKVEVARSSPSEITDTTLSGYTSARDAIDKLFGTDPRADLAVKINPDTKLMDLEATLSAFENTLGASLAESPSAGKEPPGGRPLAFTG